MPGIWKWAGDKFCFDNKFQVFTTVGVLSRVRNWYLWVTYINGLINSFIKMARYRQVL